jgi:hypothetical protein
LSSPPRKPTAAKASIGRDEITQLTQLLSLLTDIARSNQGSLTSVVQNQTVLLKAIESQNQNHVKLTELVNVALTAVSNDGKFQQELVNDLGRGIRGAFTEFMKEVRDLQLGLTQISAGLSENTRALEEVDANIRALFERIG